LERGHVIVWTNQSPGVITSNYPGKKEELAARDKAYDEAVELSHGEHVEIDGEKYRVVIIPRDVCDPIHFEPITGL
jgi:hypothetical protein